LGRVQDSPQPATRKQKGGERGVLSMGGGRGGYIYIYRQYVLWVEIYFPYVAFRYLLSKVYVCGMWGDVLGGLFVVGVV